jgi:hypothetical protein
MDDAHTTATEQWTEVVLAVERSRPELGDAFTAPVDRHGTKLHPD